MKYFGAALFFLFSHTYLSQSRQELDSLLNLLHANSKPDTNLAITYNEIAHSYNRINIDSTKVFADKALSLSAKLGFKKGMASAYNSLGIHYHLTSQFDNAIKYYQKSKDIKESLGDKKGAISSQNNMGIIFYMQGKYDKALLTYNASLEMQEKMKDTVGIPNTLNYIASVHYFLSNYERALGYYLKALELYKNNNNKPGLSQAYNNIGIIYNVLNNLDKAFENYNNSLNIAIAIGAKDLITTCYNNLGTVLMDRKNYPKALEYFTKSLNLSRDLKMNEGIALNLEKIGQIFEVQNKLDEALIKFEEALSVQEKYGQVYNTANILNSMGSVLNRLNRSEQAIRCYDRALKMAKEIKTKNLIADISFNYSVLLKKKKDFKKAFYYLTQYSSIKDSILNEDKNKSMAEMQIKFDTDAKEKEIVLLTKDKNIENLKIGEQSENIRKQRVTLYASAIGILLGMAFAFLLYKNYREKRKINILLEKKNLAITIQKKKLEEKSKFISKSILFAKNIQNAILPPTATFAELFKDAFILFQPKDVVSGDFFWINSQEEQGKKKNKKEIFVSAIDCVGHGVPGAFMSLHSYNLLERIIKDKKNSSPAVILDKLNNEVIETLNQKKDRYSSAKHGMDLAMVKITGNEIEFSGARNPLIIVTPKNEMKEIKADRMFIGGAIGNFTNTNYMAEEGSMIYLYTDGYADQKGGSENRKYFSSVFKELLVSMASKNCVEQKQNLFKIFLDWKGNNEQLDDVLIIGIRI